MIKTKLKLKRTKRSGTYYSIKDLEKLTGIKAHTIRIWEKRYNVIDPDRTDTNIRRYNDSALKKILLISSLNSQGEKISKLAELSLPELHEKVNERLSRNSGMELFIDQLVVSMVDIDEHSFSQQLKDLINWFGIERTLTEIFFPFCEKIGVMWLIDKIHPAHEHFISNMVRQKLFAEVDKLPVPTGKDVKNVILFLREDELHDIGLLFYHFLFRKAGYNTIYLGQNMPLDDLEQVAQFHDADIIATAMVTKISETNTQIWIDSLADLFPEQQVLISGQHLNEVNVTFPDNVKHLTTALELKNLIISGEL